MLADTRYLLWIDGVGGYLVCLGHRVTLGQATPDTRVDVPLFADVSRLHATVTRDGEGYLLECARPVRVNNREVSRALLQPGDRITLGASCQLQFAQPVPVSATARLDLVSGHRLKLAVDGVILMADSLVLGPEPGAHVPMPELARPVVLYRHKNGLGVCASDRLTVNGKVLNGHAVLAEDATIIGDNLSFTVEQASGQLGNAN